MMKTCSVSVLALSLVLAPVDLAALAQTLDQTLEIREDGVPDEAPATVTENVAIEWEGPRRTPAPDPESESTPDVVSLPPSATTVRLPPVRPADIAVSSARADASARAVETVTSAPASEPEPMVAEESARPAVPAFVSVRRAAEPVEAPPAPPEDPNVRPYLPLESVERTLSQAQTLPEVIHLVDRMARNASNPVEVYMRAIDLFPDHRLSLMALARATSIQLPILEDILDMPDDVFGEAAAPTQPAPTGPIVRLSRTDVTGPADPELAPAFEAHRDRVATIALGERVLADFALPGAAPVAPPSEEADEAQVPASDEDDEAAFAEALDEEFSGEVVASAEDGEDTPGWSFPDLSALGGNGMMVAGGGLAAVAIAAVAISSGSSSGSAAPAPVAGPAPAPDLAIDPAALVPEADTTRRLGESLARLMGGTDPNRADTVASFTADLAGTPVSMSVGRGDGVSAVFAAGIASESFDSRLGGNPFTRHARQADASALAVEHGFGFGTISASFLNAGEEAYGASLGYGAEIGNVGIRAALGYVSEAGYLGRRELGGAMLGIGSGNTLFASLGVSHPVSRGWSLSGAAHGALTTVTGAGTIERLDLVSTGFSIDLVGRSVMLEGDELRLSFGSPLKVEQGSYRLAGAPGSRSFALRGAGRDLTMSASWAKEISPGAAFVAGLSHAFATDGAPSRNDTSLSLGLGLRF